MSSYYKHGCDAELLGAAKMGYREVLRRKPRFAARLFRRSDNFYNSESRDTGHRHLSRDKRSCLNYREKRVSPITCQNTPNQDLLLTSATDAS
jgi:hypothetical protein